MSGVTIPDSVTSIGLAAFDSCFSLTNASIGKSVTSIGQYAFGQCRSLTAITVDQSNPAYSSMDGVLFNKQQTTLIAYPGGKTGGYTVTTSVTTIVDSAFAYCTRLNSVTIPNSVTSIGSGAFEGTMLSNVTIPSSVTSIGNYPFNGPILTAANVDTNNPAYSSMDGVLFNKNQTMLIEYPQGKSGNNYTIPSGVTSIYGWAFDGSNLSRVTIPNSVTSIGDGAFANCTSLTIITIPNSVTSIGWGAFYRCFRLTDITISARVTKIEYDTFGECLSLANITIAGSVRSIGSYAFSDCASLSQILFEANAPSPNIDLSVFSGDTAAIVYYLPGTTGWGSKFDGLPTALWIGDGLLSNSAVTPASLIAGAVGNATVSFTTTNAIPAGGQVVVAFPSGFNLTAVDSAVSLQAGLKGTWTASVSGYTLTVVQDPGGGLRHRLERR